MGAVGKNVSTMGAVGKSTQPGGPWEERLQELRPVTLRICLEIRTA